MDKKGKTQWLSWDVPINLLWPVRGQKVKPDAELLRNNILQETVLWGKKKKKKPVWLGANMCFHTCL